MGQQEFYEKTLKQQEGRIQEMEQIISLLEEENSLQRQLMEKLQEENQMLKKHLDDYSNAVQRMLKDSDSR